MGSPRLREVNADVFGLGRAWHVYGSNFDPAADDPVLFSFGQGAWSRSCVVWDRCLAGHGDELDDTPFWVASVFNDRCNSSQPRWYADKISAGRIGCDPISRMRLTLVDFTDFISGGGAVAAENGRLIALIYWGETPRFFKVEPPMYIAKR